MSRSSVCQPRRPRFPYSNPLTDRVANARVINRLHAHAFPPASFAQEEIIVLSHGEANFYAAVVRARLFPDPKVKSDLIITVQVRQCKDTVEALIKLYQLSRAMLRSAMEMSASVGQGGTLGNWQPMFRE